MKNGSSLYFGVGDGGRSCHQASVNYATLQAELSYINFKDNCQKIHYHWINLRLKKNKTVKDYV